MVLALFTADTVPWRSGFCGAGALETLVGGEGGSVGAGGAAGDSDREGDATGGRPPGVVVGGSFPC